MNPRRWLCVLVILLTVYVCFFLQGCASDYYRWQAGNAPCDSITWKQVEPERLPGLCSDGKTPATTRTNCALGCVIASPYSEEEAKQLYTVDGDSVWHHEVVMHAVLGLKHQ